MQLLTLFCSHGWGITLRPGVVKYRIETEGEVTTGNSNRGR